MPNHTAQLSPIKDSPWAEELTNQTAKISKQAEGGSTFTTYKEHKGRIP